MEKYLLIVLAALIIAGCSPSQDNLEVFAEKTGTHFDDIANSSVIVEVCNRKLTKRDILENAEMNIALRVHKNPDYSKLEQQKTRILFYKLYPEEFIRQSLIENYAETNGISLSDGTLESFKKRAFRIMRSKKDETLDNIFAAEGVDAKLVESRIRFEALEYEVKTAISTKNPPGIDVEWADRKIKDIEDYNKRMAITNALVYARATNVWEQLKAGADFTAVASKYTEIEKERKDNCYWGSFESDFLKDDLQLCLEVKKIKPGQFTPPIEGDNGLMIAYLNGVTQDGSYELSRIFFHLPLFYEIPTKSELLESAINDFNKKKYASLVKALRKNAIIEFPNGTNLFSRIDYEKNKR